MAREESPEKSEQELRERVWELADDIEFCMLVTWDGQRQRARPMDAHVDEEAGAIYFLSDVAGAKLDELEEYPKALVTFSKNMKFVSMSGTATVSNDRRKIRELFEASSKAWWDSADDPDIRLITFRPDQAELWDSPNLLVSSALMLTAAVSGAKPQLGDHGKVAI
jgi:general stress protein 26